MMLAGSTLSACVRVCMHGCGLPSSARLDDRTQRASKSWKHSEVFSPSEISQKSFAFQTMLTTRFRGSVKATRRVVVAVWLTVDLDLDCT